MLTILYEDDWIVAISKPAGMLVHRTKIARDAEEFALQKLRDQIGQKVYPVHRLDRKTSGVLLFAKSSSMVSALQEQWQSGELQKQYIAIVRGHFPNFKDLDHPLIREDGKLQDARTLFHCLEQIEIDWPNHRYQTSRYSLIQAFLKTGRMHQIRKHCNHLRHPVIGDRPHGCNKQNALFLEKMNLNKMLLHAHRIVFKHPVTSEYIEMVATMPEHFIDVMESLNFQTIFRK
ncbi:MAG: pseudouridylate synthase [Crocinitomicaceae bacterium]|nr:pseudouridylate synthase [Crocinitomicaceae bacterium]